MKSHTSQRQQDVTNAKAIPNSITKTSSIPLINEKHQFKLDQITMIGWENHSSHVKTIELYFSFKKIKAEMKSVNNEDKMKSKKNEKRLTLNYK